MPTEIDVIAIVLMESFGAAFFLSAFMFLKQSRRIVDKMEALQEFLKKARVTGERRESSCYSYKWVMSHSLKSRNPVGLLIGSIGPGGFLIMGIMALSAILAFTLLIVFYSVGYTLFIAMIGTAILFETGALEAYSYARSVQKAPLEQLVDEDLSYMGIAKEAFEMATLRFLIVGATFAVAGPFIPQIFSGLCFALALYMKYTIFQATEIAQNVSLVLAMVIATVLPGILLYLPELVGRTVLRKIKELTRRIQKREREPQSASHHVPELAGTTEAHKYAGH